MENSLDEDLNINMTIKNNIAHKVDKKKCKACSFLRK